MATELVIVESPAKAQTLGRFLGKDYTVKASLGHVRDLPRDKLAVEVESDFLPTYVIPIPKRKLLREIKALAQKARTVYLATDPDREGEAISWHLVEAAGLEKMPHRRVVFHEITKEAVTQAFKHPRDIDLRLVNAQQARRVLDRLVGYKISPILGKTVRRGLSAGRVQSVALRLIVDRENEVKGFVPVEYWSLDAELAKLNNQAFQARLVGKAGGKKIELHDKKQTDGLVADLEGAACQVSEVKQKRTQRQPAPPFITSTLQQEAWHKLGFSAKRTMAIAQQLYEGLPLGAEGPTGLITYMRTDSTQVAESAVAETRGHIRSKFGKQYLPASPR
ncbi:MAG: type I DNA topoisomerase, partial [Chloroflexi bacterium]|nr:type I DNA topoisomerase [Chloroflexota bacterium]